MNHSHDFIYPQGEVVKKSLNVSLARIWLYILLPGLFIVQFALNIDMIRTHMIPTLDHYSNGLLIYFKITLCLYGFN